MQAIRRAWDIILAEWTKFSLPIHQEFSRDRRYRVFVDIVTKNDLTHRAISFLVHWIFEPQHGQKLKANLTYARQMGQMCSVESFSVVEYLISITLTLEMSSTRLQSVIARISFLVEVSQQRATLNLRALLAWGLTALQFLVFPKRQSCLFSPLPFCEVAPGSPPAAEKSQRFKKYMINNFNKKSPTENYPPPGLERYLDATADLIPKIVK